ncbi:MAG: replication-associated recombination protein A [Deltaproteobacteria bacterium]|nr:replication-associated recombination protein A [Deltaproteobacteria bacterium]
MIDKIKQRSLPNQEPLAERMRPRTLDEVVGQDRAIGKESSFGQLLRSQHGYLPSVILCGPPGTGKTTIARVIADTSNYHFVRLSGVLDSVADVRKVVADAQTLLDQQAQHTLALVDEIHRFNKAQQDAFLPHIESGLLTVIGQTTENVSFRIRNALLSRMRVIMLDPLSDIALEELVHRALKDKDRGLGTLGLDIQPAAIKLLVRLAQGDARRVLNGLEWAAITAQMEKANILTEELVIKGYGDQPAFFDQGDDYHYDCISAFIKSLRGSDPEAALYYMIKALDAGEDSLFITRRMIIFASEDASCDPRALEMALNVDKAIERIGMPEGRINLAQGVVYLACCAKSNASYKALRAIEEVVAKHPDLPIPKRLCNAPTELMKSQGKSLGYKYPHDYPQGFVPERYLPTELGDLRVYEPTDRGLDAQIKERLKYYKSLIQQTTKQNLK